MRSVLLAVALIAEAVCLALAGRSSDFAAAGSALQFVPLCSQRECALAHP